MIARSRLASLALAAALPAALAGPALARDGVTPADLLAAKPVPRNGKATTGKAAADRGFADRIARIGAIMGSDAGAAPRLRIPQKPEWTRPRQRAADALAGSR